MTLNELLIVVVILTTLVAAAIPLLAPASDARRIREAARALNTYITAAQSRAILTGRPHGVALKKLSADTLSPSDNGVCLEVLQVEQPPPYAGFDERARVRLSLDRRQQFGGVRVQFLARVSPDVQTNDFLPIGLDNDLIPPGLLRPGDVIEVAGKRYSFTDTDVDPNNIPFYYGQSGTPDGHLLVRPLDPSGYSLNFSVAELDPSLLSSESLNWTPPLPYKILRQPSLTSTQPLQLPEGTAIDLRASGDQEVFYHYPDGNLSQNKQIDNREPVVIMFTPDGSVERMRLNLEPRLNNGNTVVDAPTTYSQFLLVGLRENVPVEDANFSFSTLSGANDEEIERTKIKYNWLNLDSRWVVIGPQSGSIVTVENAFVEPIQIAATYANDAIAQRNEEIIRAREFARELTRTGGR